MAAKKTRKKSHKKARKHHAKKARKKSSKRRSKKSKPKERHLKASDLGKKRKRWMCAAPVRSGCGGSGSRVVR